MALLDREPICPSLTAWDQFLEFARSRSSLTAFQNWIDPIVCLGVEEDECVLQVPNVFVQEYLLSNFGEDLRSFLPVRSDGKPSIRFVIADLPLPEPNDVQARSAASSASSDQSGGMKLNRSYTFDSFIEGTCNQFAKSAAFGVASRPGRVYNPFFIHGSVGLGKTHLLHAIGHHLLATHRKIRVQCLTAEEFVNALVDSLRNKTVDRLKKTYRNLDVLLVDDIQFLQERMNFENEFCTMFEALINQSRQIVITSDKSPSDLKLSERMVARMEWGLVAQLGMPDLETRVAILQHKAELRGLDLEQKTAFLLAQHLQSNVRQIEGIVNKLCAQSRLLSLPVTEELAMQNLGELLGSSQKEQYRITAEEIIELVSNHFGVKITDIRSTKRIKDVSLARQVAMFLAREWVRGPLMALGLAFQKTHSTILHAYRTIERKLPNDKELFVKVETVRAAIRAKAVIH
ncbi:chromosomal replication initiator protein DnaA [Candidatus Similichlamydia laticola]|uniref:Chromosomal replication initiator protein DnaA n=1 Tax=Candidatus Similichlamydia laticola TaxID=2170265 RepID=A0A369KDS3_9BACT|nr:chromosomal replication initiator protein DnaA [Candidatus Similichlamydia laticola]RDB31752.1 Chromosomal replication initiator protein DnaA [Candidatus Similichlamydia laticola]